MGPYAVTILDRFVHGADEEAVIKSLGFQKSDRPRALRKLEDGKEQIAGVLREHLGEGNQTDRVLLRMLEVILNTNAHGRTLCIFRMQAGVKHCSEWPPPTPVVEVLGAV